MQFAEELLVHQVHPAKVGADVTASALSNVLLWRGRPKAALAVRVVLPLAGSVAVLRLADLDALARSRRGKYVHSHMPRSAQAVRLVGDALMGLGAHRRSAALVLAGAVVIGAGWSQAAWPQTSRPNVTSAASKDRHRGRSGCCAARRCGWLCDPTGAADLSRVRH
jgi:hypothetical protein